MPKFAVHFNTHLLAAVDILTTGPNVFEHDIYEICILPLDSECKPLKEANAPFAFRMKPSREKEIDTKYISKADYVHSLVKGIDPFQASELLDIWFAKLKLETGKQILPLAADWPTIFGFLKAWAGHYQITQIFHPWFRDITSAACYANDRADINIEQIPYPKCTMRYVCSTLKVPLYKPESCLTNCVAIADAYRRMLRQIY